MVIGPPLPVQWVPPKQSAKVNDIETVRQIVTLARGDGMEISVLAALLQNGNEGGAGTRSSESLLRGLEEWV